MIEYIYIVKVPGCDDEHFNFFEEAKNFALNFLSKNPYITQVEVCRNDFGECTDSHDLGTVWSCEEMMNDTKPEGTVFSKAETFGISKDELNSEISESVEDNLWYCEYDGIALGTVIAKTEEEAYREMEKKYPEYNYSLYDGVAVVYPADKAEISEVSDDNEYSDEDITFETDCVVKSSSLDETQLNIQKASDEDKEVDIKSLVEMMEENEDEVECKWCNELFDKDDCRYEVNLGYLCPQCEAAIKSRGETLTFREDTQSTDKDTLTETYDPKEEVELYYKELTITVYSDQRDADDWDEEEYASDYTFKVSADDVANVLWDTLLTDEDVADVEGGFDTLEDDAAWKSFLNTHFDALVAKYYDKLLDYFEEDAIEQFSIDGPSWSDLHPSREDRMMSWSDDHEDGFDHFLSEEKCTDCKEEEIAEFVQAPDDKPLLAESDEDEIQEVSDLMLCPECGKTTFDNETGICINCGFNAY